MIDKPWADIDPYWREKESRALEQRAAHEKALREGHPSPHPNPWDLLDPTKVAPDATQEQILERRRAFRKICRPHTPKRHVI